jgi:hypothetical protein
MTKFIISLKNYFNQDNITLQEGINKLCGCNGIDPIDQKSKFTSLLVDELSTRRRHFGDLKQGLIGQNENNKIILDGVNSLEQFKEGTTIALDNKHIGIVYKNYEAFNTPIESHTMTIFEVEGQNNILKTLKLASDHILELKADSDIELDNFSSGLIPGAMDDREDVRNWREDKLHRTNENNSLITANARLVRIMHKIGKSIAENDPTFNLDNFKEIINIPYNELSNNQLAILQFVLENIDT